MQDYAMVALEKLPAGEELDELVAMRVMKWKLGEDHYWYDQENYVQGKIPDEDFGDTYGFWNPSKNLACAWRVVEKLRRNFTNFSISAANGWTCTCWDVPAGSHDGKNIVSFHGNTPEEAICKTAYLAAKHNLLKRD